jgi:galactonate dehydratase
VVESSLRTEQGYWLPVTAPGLGVEVNEKEAARHPFVQEPLQSAVYAPDGAVLDW